MNGYAYDNGETTNHSNSNTIDVEPFIPSHARPPKPRVHISFLTQFRPSLILLQITGIYPRSLPYGRNRHGNYQLGHCVKSSSLLMLSIGYVFVNAAIIGIVLWVITEYWHAFGLWHAETVASIITGMKPLQSAMNLIIFAGMRNRHKKFLRYLEELNSTFAREFGVSPNIVCINKRLIIFGIALFTLTFCVRATEYLLTVFLTDNYLVQAQAFNWLFEYVPFVLLPMFTLWQLLPLVYFTLLTAIIRFWLGVLIKAIYTDPCFEHHDMTVIFDQFCSIAQAQEKLGAVFFLFVLFNLGLVACTLCLTVYFLTQATTIVPDDSDVIFYFNFVWSTLQIIILIVYLVTICIAGFKTNEKTNIFDKCDAIISRFDWSTLLICIFIVHLAAICMAGFNTNEMSRKVLEAVLYTKPRNQQQRFQIFCLSEKLHLQYGWGIAVWRGFLIERGLLFTIVGLIITWALVLLRMKPQESCDFINDIPKHIKHAANLSSLFRVFGGLILPYGQPLPSIWPTKLLQPGFNLTNLINNSKIT